MNHEVSSGSSRGGVFISYATPDLEWAESVHAELERHGFRPWMAPRGIASGEWQWGERIDEAIRTCSVFVILYSESSGKSPWVRKEIYRAAEEGCRLLPIRLDSSPLATGLRLHLADLQQHWIDAARLPKPEVLSRLVHQAGNPDEGVRLPPPPPRFGRMALEIAGTALVLVGSSYVVLHGMGGGLFLSPSQAPLFELLTTLLGLGLYFLARRRQSRKLAPPWRGTILIYVLALLVGGYLWDFSHDVVHEWNPTSAEVCNLAAMPPGSEIKDEALASIQGPLRVQRSGNAFLVRVLVPLPKWLSTPTRTYIQASPSIDEILQNDGIVFAQRMLPRETKALRKTRLRFLFLSLVLLLLLSLAHALLMTSVDRTLAHS